MVAREFKDDMAQGWSHGEITTMDAFYHYYSLLARDQDDFEQRLKGLRTPVKVVWGELDPYIRKEMGAELAERLGSELKLLSGIGHYPHFQAPELVIAEIQESFSQGLLFSPQSPWEPDGDPASIGTVKR